MVLEPSLINPPLADTVARLFRSIACVPMILVPLTLNEAAVFIACALPWMTERAVIVTCVDSVAVAWTTLMPAAVSVALLAWSVAAFIVLRALTWKSSASLNVAVAFLVTLPSTDSVPLDALRTVPCLVTNPLAVNVTCVESVELCVISLRPLAVSVALVLGLAEAFLVTNPAAPSVAELDIDERPANMMMAPLSGRYNPCQVSWLGLSHVPISSHISEVNISTLAFLVLRPFADTLAEVVVETTGLMVRLALTPNARAPDIDEEPARVLLGCPDSVADVASVALASLILMLALRTAPSVVRLAEAETNFPPATLTDACEARLADPWVMPVT